MSLPELTKELVVRIVSRVFKEDFWTIVFDDEAFAKTGERIWLINDVRRHKAGEKALTGRLGDSPVDLGEPGRHESAHRALPGREGAAREP
jgi:hypothetical protein